MEKKQILENILNCKNIKKLDKRVFLKAWQAIFFLSPELHPDDVCGWPKRLKPLAREAFRKRKIGEFTDAQLYPWSEALKGIKARRLRQK